MFEANDNGLTFWVQFFDGAGDDALATDRIGPYPSIVDAMDAAVEAHSYAVRHGLQWFPTEITFD
jgi:hypothetical protein